MENATGTARLMAELTEIIYSQAGKGTVTPDAVERVRLLTSKAMDLSDSTWDRITAEIRAAVEEDDNEH